MKGISGIIGGAILILVLIILVSLLLASMRYLYEVQQLETKQAISEVSQPHVVQIGPSSVESSGELFAAYVIYPDGKVERIDQAVSGIHNFQNLLNGDPWAIIVFSNGQWINVSNALNQLGTLGYGPNLVPYYPYSITPGNTTQMAKFLMSGIEYNLPLYYEINATFNDGGTTLHTIVNPSDPLVYGFGRILDVPVISENGWLNFTAVSVNGAPVSFIIVIQNATGTLVVVDVSFGNFVMNFSFMPPNPNITGFPNTTYGPIFYGRYNISYGINQFITNFVPTAPAGYTCAIPRSSEPPYVLSKSFSYDLYNASTINGPTKPSIIYYSPLLKVAIKFSQGRPAQMYVWVGWYNGSGISWYRVLLPGFDVPTGHEIGYANPMWVGGENVIYNVVWLNVSESMWPVNIYSEYVNASSVQLWYPPYPVPQYHMYAEPLVPEPGSVIEVIPYWQNAYIGTAIVNVAYSI